MAAVASVRKRQNRAIGRRKSHEDDYIWLYCGVCNVTTSSHFGNGLQPHAANL